MPTYQYRFTYSGTITLDDTALLKAASANLTVIQQGQERDEIDTDLHVHQMIVAAPDVHVDSLVNKVFSLELANLHARFKEVLPGAVVEHGRPEVEPLP